MSNYKQKAEAYCAKTGITLDDECGREEIYLCVTTPKGLVLSSVGDHSSVTAWPTSEGSKAEAWKCVWENLRDGVEPCRIENCELCEEGE